MTFPVIRNITRVMIQLLDLACTCRGQVSVYASKAMLHCTCSSATHAGDPLGASAAVLRMSGVLLLALLLLLRCSGSSLDTGGLKLRAVV